MLQDEFNHLMSAKRYDYIVERNAINCILNTEDKTHVTRQLEQAWLETTKMALPGVTCLSCGPNWFELHTANYILVVYNEYTSPTALYEKKQFPLVLGRYNWNPPTQVSLFEETIPHSVLSHILSNLSGVHLLRSCQFVNRKWRAVVATNNTYWNKRLERFKLRGLYMPKLLLPNDTPFQTVRRHAFCNWRPNGKQLFFGTPSADLLMQSRNVVEVWRVAYIRWVGGMSSIHYHYGPNSFSFRGNTIIYLRVLDGKIQWHNARGIPTNASTVLRHVWLPTIMNLLE